MADPWAEFDVKPDEAAPARAPSKADPWAAFDTKPEEQPPPKVEPPAPTPWAAPTGGEYGDLGAQPWAQGGAAPTESPLARVGSAVGEGIAAGAAQGASGETTDALRRLGVLPPSGRPGTTMQTANEIIWNPLAAGGDLLLRGGNALVGGFQRGAEQAGIEVGAPQLGRDIAALPEAFPTGEAAGTIGVHPPAPPRNALAPPIEAGVDRPYLTPQAQAQIEQSRPGIMPAQANESTPTTVPRFASDSPLSVATQPNALGPAIPTMRVAPEPAPTPAAAPQPAGAQASTAAEANLTPQQEAAYRSTAEGQKLLEAQIPGERDDAAYVQGVQPNTAEIEQTVHAARDLKMLNQKVPEVAQEAQQIANDNSEARARHFDDISGSPVDLQNAEDARRVQGEQDLAAAWANKRPTDAQPVVDAADAILRGPSGKQDVVTRNVRAIRDKLFDADGNIETDPEVLYGVRKEINNRLSKEAAREEPTNQLAARELIQLRDLLDQSIEAGAQGFGAYLENWRNASRRIDEMSVLQDHRAGLFDSANRMQYSRVQKMMRSVVDRRMQGGANPYQSITPENMARLWALRDDLRRSASAQDLARAAGSDTFQNSWHAMRDATINRAPALIGASIGGMAGGGPVGAGIGAGLGQGLSQVLTNRAARANRRRGMSMLRPDTPLRNPLAGPP